MTRRSRWGFIGGSLVFGLALGVAPGCSGNSSNQSQDMTVYGGPVAGAADTHCIGDGGMIVQTTSMSACFPDLAGPQPDMASSSTEPEYGATMYNSSGSDDDCKYNVQFVSSPPGVIPNEKITFVVKAQNRTDGSVVTGAMVVPEVYLNASHPAPNSGVMTTESPAGTYTITPIVFDASGTWTIRFHFFEMCPDVLDASPHGHAAFYFNVE